MAAQTIAGLFNHATQGEVALRELQKAGFSSAQISELADDHDEAPKKLSNPFTDFFKDHTSSGSDFQHSLVHLGISESEAQYFEEGVARGGSLVTVKADERADEAIAILRRNGATSTPERNAAAGATGATTAATGTAGAFGAAGAGTTAGRIEGEQTLQLRAERLAVEKTRVASGAVRIGKRVVSATETVEVPVSRDELVIERRAVTDGTVVGGTIGDDKTISVPLAHDEVRVAKETYATEEVEVGTRAVGGVERVSETVRREELAIEGSEPKTSSTTPRI